MQSEAGYYVGDSQNNDNEEKKPDKEEYILYDSTYMKLQKTQTIVMAAVVAWGQDREQFQRGSSLVVMDLLVILIVVMVSWVQNLFKCIKLQIFKYVWFVVNDTSIKLFEEEEEGDKGAARSLQVLCFAPADTDVKAHNNKAGSLAHS